MANPPGRRATAVLAQLLIAGLAALLLLWGLTEKYLWQDEAQTAILAARMLKFGRPLAYDGVNLLTTDVFYPEEAIAGQTHSVQAGLDFHKKLGEFKPDTTWTWQPWGLFAFAAAGIGTLGHTTLAARLPFAIAGIVTVLLLFQLVRKRVGSLSMAVLAAAFLLGNPYWILHARQCRYYALSSLFLVLTLAAYIRWHERERWGALALVAAAWGWFQVDYGTVWPALGVLLVHAMRPGGPGWKRTAAVGAALGASIAPFFYYYDLLGRGRDRGADWGDRFLTHLFNLNEYVIPIVVLLAAVALLAWRSKQLPAAERSLAVISCGTLLALLVWVPAVSGRAYLRYAIVAAPAGALLLAWVTVRLCARYAPGLTVPVAVVLIFTPWASLPLHAVVPPPEWYPHSPWLRSEFLVWKANLLGRQPDPNRAVIEWLKQHSKPSDEILINYEDLPLMYYLPNPVRGGMSAFRVEDDSTAPPRFVVLRHSVPFTHWPIFQREIQRYQWDTVRLKAPDVRWGNNPDARGQEEDPARAPDLYIARRLGP